MKNSLRVWLQKSARAASSLKLILSVQRHMLQAYCSLKGNYTLCIQIKDLEKCRLSLWNKDAPLQDSITYPASDRAWAPLSIRNPNFYVLNQFRITRRKRKKKTTKYFPAVSCLPSLLCALETVPLMLQQPTAQSPNVVFLCNLTLFPSEKSTHTAKQTQKASCVSAAVVVLSSSLSSLPICSLSKPYARHTSLTTAGTCLFLPLDHFSLACRLWYGPVAASCCQLA